MQYFWKTKDVKSYIWTRPPSVPCQESHSQAGLANVDHTVSSQIHCQVQWTWPDTVRSSYHSNSHLESCVSISTEAAATWNWVSWRKKSEYKNWGKSRLKFSPILILNLVSQSRVRLLCLETESDWVEWSISLSQAICGLIISKSYSCTF